MTHQSLNAEALRKIDAYWRASNYLSVGQIYLRDNPLLSEPLAASDIKKLLVGHWGTVPGQNFIYVHLNRIVKEHGLNMLYVSGPGHGGQAMVSQTWLEGSYSEIYPAISQDIAGMKALFAQFSFPGGISSHVAPATPGSIHEGGELGYSLSHAFGAVFDNPSLVVACVVGDGEAETGALATAWHGNKFLDPVGDGAVLPILHLNGYKISNPTILARIGHEELEQFFRGCGWTPIFVEGEDPLLMHQAMACAMDEAIDHIHQIQDNARNRQSRTRPRWPMIVLRSPKGWTGPRFVDGLQVEGSFRSHQVPLLIGRSHPENIPLLEAWMKSYEAQDLFDDTGRLIPELAELAPRGSLRMGANPHANGGKLLVDLKMPDFRSHGIRVERPGCVEAQDTLILGAFLRDLIRLNTSARNFRLFGPDETLSNRLDAVFEVTQRQWEATILESDEYLASSGRVLDSMLSEQQCQGWLEGYLLTGRHGLFSSYEAFVRIVDSMVSQHAKWLKVCAELAWRKPVASLNYLLTAHVWQQDHNGYSHQDPGFLDHVINKKARVVRVYLPPDANCLLSVMDHCLRSRNLVNVVVASKHLRPQWLGVEDAERHCARGIGIWGWASNDEGGSPDIVMACSGETPTLETLAAVSLLNVFLPDLKIRVVNVVDLLRLQSGQEHAHGLSEREYAAIFTEDAPVVFAFHGYPSLIRLLTCQRGHHRLKVHGYQEEGAITTAFDMRVLNQLDRFHLLMSAIDSLPEWTDRGSYARQWAQDKLIEHHKYVREHGEDMPEIQSWKWTARTLAHRKVL